MTNDSKPILVKSADAPLASLFPAIEQAANAPGEHSRNIARERAIAPIKEGLGEHLASLAQQYGVNIELEISPDKGR